MYDMREVNEEGRQEVCTTVLCMCASSLYLFYDSWRPTFVETSVRSSYLEKKTIDFIQGVFRILSPLLCYHFGFIFFVCSVLRVNETTVQCHMQKVVVSTLCVIGRRNRILLDVPPWRVDASNGVKDWVIAQLVVFRVQENLFQVSTNG